MDTNEPKARASAKSGQPRMIPRIIGKLSLFVLALAAILFGASGRWDWAMAWVFIAMLLACVGVNILVLGRVNPEVLGERLQRRKSAKKWDKAVVFFIAVPWLALLLVAGLDRRFAASPPIAPALRIAAMALLVAGDLGFLWAMAVNAFFSRVVRIQEERGHHVVTAGPYQYVRHPGYVSWLAMTAAVPIILGSLWALIPASLAMALMVVRTALEDRMLREELVGYKDYAARVRWRLLPGLW